MFVSGKLVGGVDIVCELIEEGEFDAMLPATCKPLPPKEALLELLSQHKVAVFLMGDEGKDKIIETLSQTSFTYVFVNLQVEVKWQPILNEEFGVTELPVVFKDGKPFNLADLKSLIPVKETL